ncbi:MAG: hypothetical protein M1822_004845 [Bathelium mastoideum]|nr:MAG: hypothetical protein M1822_004845 [Bathelium mastoideum]
MDKIDMELDVASRQAIEFVFDKHDSVHGSKNFDREQSSTSSHSPTTSVQGHKEPSLENQSSVDTPAQPALSLPKEILSMLHEGFRGDPLPASLSKPPMTHTSLLNNKIQWYGSWREGWEPRWGVIKPRIEDIRKVAMPFMQFCGIDPEKFSVAPFYEGMWNKLYLITSKNERTGAITERIFRITLPVNPWFKIQSEVATMEYVRKETSIPIPKVYIFESSMANALGFEWMIMEKMEGRTFKDARESISQPIKESLNGTIAEWVHQLSQLQFDRIGSLYREWDPRKPDYLAFKLGPVTSDHFLGPWRTEKEIFRGPFQNEAQLYRSIVELALADILDSRHLDLAHRAWAEEQGFGLVSNQDNEDESQIPTTVYSSKEAFGPLGVKNVCFSILGLLPLIEDKLAQKPRTYVLHHFDISKNNVLVDSAGAAVALLDWENLSAESLCQIYPWPSIIDPTRYEPPEPSQWSGPKPDWYIAAETDYETRLAADAFMLRLGELKSYWPQTEGEEQNYMNDFEEDLAELGSLVKGIHAGWAELELCNKMKEKYSEVFQPILSQKPIQTQDGNFPRPIQSSLGPKEAQYARLFDGLRPNKKRILKWKIITRKLGLNENHHR